MIMCLRPKPRRTPVLGQSNPFGLGLTRCLGAALLVSALTASVQGQNSVTLAWDPSPGSSIAGYRLYEGAASGSYTNVIATGKATTATVSSLVSGTTYYFAVTAFDTIGLESAFSSEISYTAPPSPSPGPTIALTSPTNGAVYTAPATINLSASVPGNGQTIAQVEFYNGATLLGAVASAPYSFSWKNVSAGAYSLSVKVVYNSGDAVGSLAVNVQVAAGWPGSSLTFAANSGTIKAPFVASNGTLFQAVETPVTTGGRVAYSFNILNAGNYLVSALVRAPNEGQNSLYVNIDAEPTDPLMIWDIPVSSGLTNQTVSWRGKGTPDPASAQYRPKVFTLSAGTHQLIIRGREANTSVSTISIIAAPPTLQIRATPGGSVILSGTGQAGQRYHVQCSLNLKAWTVIGTVMANASGAFTFADPAGTSRPIGLYRLQRIAVTPPRLQIRASAGGPVILSGTGQAGQTYNVLCSQNLKDWTVLGAVTIDAGGAFTFTDFASNTRPSGIYRLQGQ